MRRRETVRARVEPRVLMLFSTEPLIDRHGEVHISYMYKGTLRMQ